MTKGKKTIAIIACDHGYGHIRRCMLISGGLARQGWQVDLLAPAIAVEKLQGGTKMPANIKVNDFEAGIEVERVRRGEASTWTQKLPSLDDFDLVLCDNLAEILTVRSDAILSGSFLWHRVLEDINLDYYDRMEELLLKYKPPLITSELFATENLTRQTRYYPVGLYSAEPVPLSQGRGKDLLISCGMSSEAESKYASFIEKLARQDQSGFEKVWVEPRLLPQNHPDWMLPATFNAKMYLSLQAALCRPGVGTLTDCLWGGARVFCSFEPGNREMVTNAEALDRVGVGEAFASIEAAFQAACDFRRDQGKQEEHRENLRRISFNGAEKAVQVILSIGHHSKIT